MRARVPLAIALLATLSAGTGVAAEAPVAVSPGNVGHLVQVEGRCPTFNWGSVPGAASYQLVVYRLGETDEEARAVVQASVPGSAQVWTPSLEQCVQRGGRYAWSVRAVGDEGAGDWSTPALFQVAAPTLAEFEEAVAVVRSYLALQHGAGGEPGQVNDSDPNAEPGSEARASASSPEPRAASPTALKVDQGIEAASFTGDGSALTNLDPANLSSAVSLNQGGTGATDAAGARTMLDVAQGPHTADTNAMTECPSEQLYDGDGNCVLKTALNDLTECAVGDVPTFGTGTGWSCQPPITIVSAIIPAWTEGTIDVTAQCPAGTTLVMGGLGLVAGPSGLSPCLISTLSTDVFFQLYESPAGMVCYIQANGANLFFEQDCNCFALCR